MQNIRIIDEVQDLPYIYGQALKKIQEITQIDIYMVGDYLQSIYEENNAMSLFQISNSSNKVQKFKSESLKRFVNKIINFDKFQERGIVPIEELQLNKQEQVEDLHIEFQPYFNSKEQQWLTIQKILGIFEQEIKNGFNKPEDFAIISPFLSNVEWLFDLQILLEEFWKKQLDRKDKFVYLYQSEQNRPINLAESKNATRIQFIYSAKGTGRNIVIVVNLSEQGLKRFSKGQINIVYQSLLYVAVTRQKQKLYLFCQDKDDDIGQRLQSQDVCKPIIAENNYDINNKKISYKSLEKDVLSIIEKDNEILSSLDYIVKELPYQYEKEIIQKQIIDYNHHILRHNLMIHIFMTSFSSNQKQIFTILKRKNIIPISPQEYIKKLQQMQSKKIEEKYLKNQIKFQTIYLLIFTNEKTIYYNKATDFVEKSIQKIFSKNDITGLCFIKMIIFQYLYNWTYGLFKEFSIMQLYDFVLWYKKNFDVFQFISTHDQCIYNQQIQVYEKKPADHLVQFYSGLKDIKHLGEEYQQQFGSDSTHTFLKYNEIFFLQKECKVWKNQALYSTENEITTLTHFNQEINKLNIKQLILKCAITQLFEKQSRHCFISIQEPINFIQLPEIFIKQVENKVKTLILQRFLKLNIKITDQLFLKRQLTKGTVQEKEKFQKLMEDITKDQPEYIKNIINNNRQDLARDLISKNQFLQQLNQRLEIMTDDDKW